MSSKMPGAPGRMYAGARDGSVRNPRPAPSAPAPACGSPPSAWRNFSTTLSTSRSIWSGGSTESAPLLRIRLAALELDGIDDGHDGGVDGPVPGHARLPRRAPARVEHHLAHSGAHRV